MVLLMVLFGIVAASAQVFASSGLDFIGFLFLLLIALILVVVSVVALFRLRAERHRALGPPVIIGLGLWAGWPAAVDLGGLIREAWFRSNLAETEEMFRWGADEHAQGRGFAAELPPSARAACNRIHFRTDSLGNAVAYCDVLRHLTYAYDPAGITAAEGWRAREPFAPDWYRLRR